MEMKITGLKQGKSYMFLAQVENMFGQSNLSAPTQSIDIPNDGGI